MDRFEALELEAPVLSLSEQSDGMVRDLYREHRLVATQQTGWLVPLMDRAESLDALPHARIETLEANDWKMVVAQRVLGDHGYQKHTEACAYHHTSGKLFAEEYKIYRKHKSYRPRVHALQRNDVDGELSRELYQLLYSGIFVPKLDAAIAGEKGCGIEMSPKRKAAYQKGNFLMRICEKAYIGQTLDFSDDRAL